MVCFNFTISLKIFSWNNLIQLLLPFLLLGYPVVQITIERQDKCLLFDSFPSFISFQDHKYHKLFLGLFSKQS